MDNEHVREAAWSDAARMARLTATSAPLTSCNVSSTSTSVQIASCRGLMPASVHALMTEGRSAARSRVA